MSDKSFQFVHSAHIKPKPKPDNTRTQMWSMLTAGLVFGFLGMYMSVTKPMSERMHLLEAELTAMQSNMQHLVDSNDGIWKTNDLLTGLRQQQRQLLEAEKSLASIRRLRNEVLTLAAGQETAMQTLRQMTVMQEALEERSKNIDDSRNALANMVSLQDHVIRLGDSAGQSRDSLIVAKRAMGDMRDLHERIERQANSMGAAGDVVTAMTDLTDDLMDKQQQIDESQKAIQKIDQLQTALIEQGGTKTEAAEESLQKMANLEAKLVRHQAGDLDQAAENVDRMILFQRKLAEDNTKLISAMQTVELLEGFQNEIERQATSLNKMRTDLQEVAMLKSTVEETLAVLKPLVQLADLRGMSDREVRQAAQSILDRRIASQEADQAVPRIANGSIASPVIGPKQEVKRETRKVPDPIDLE